MQSIRETAYQPAEPPDAADAGVPTEALARAGVELSRAEHKAIDRSHRAVREAAVVAPGVKVASMTIAAFPGGRIGRIPPVAKPGDSQGGEGRRDTRGGCAKEE